MFELGALNSDVHRLSSRRFQLRLSLRHIGLRGDPALIPVGRQFQSFLVDADRLIEQLFLCVERAELEIVSRQIRMEAQSDCLQIGGTGLSTGLARLNRPANATPQISLVRQIERKLKVRESL